MIKDQVKESIEKACSRIAPAWTLENSIAVNPYLGLSDLTFEKAAEVLKYRGNVQLYMPLDFYLKYIKEGKINKNDLQKALDHSYYNESIDTFLQWTKTLVNKDNSAQKINTLTQAAEELYQVDFTGLMVNHVSEWMGSFFKDSKAVTPETMFHAWKTYSTLDLLPELSGVKKYRAFIKGIPDNAWTAILVGLEKLKIKEQWVETYVHTLLLKTIGWSSYCAGLDWQNKLYGGEIGFVKVMLAILISWESALIQEDDALKSVWNERLKQIKNASNSGIEDEYLQAQAMLQDAFDFSHQRELMAQINNHKTSDLDNEEDLPEAQMVFCIDVRSEVYRRNLEAVKENIETLGFAGFFGFPVNYKPLIHENEKNQCPALIPSGPKVYETTKEAKDLQKKMKTSLEKGMLREAWTKFKTGSVSSFSFVSPLGLFYLPKLIGDSLGWTTPIKNPKKQEFGQVISGNHKLDLSSIPFNERLGMAKSALSAMGLTHKFAPLILITGHGSTSVNNPHASGLDCGACGGNSGEINALVAQLILNDKDIRSSLKKENIIIPDDTVFIACLHNTTTDVISILDEEAIPTTHIAKMEAIKGSLVLASQAARKERASRMGISKEDAETSIFRRANDWAQVRPEWGLAGCSSFIIAPRNRTKGLNLKGKAFLHSYQWQADKSFNILETIMTAPMIVTSWINLQYYASTVDNKKMGAGNKTLHNVTAHLGVMEGSRGDLRIGLPLQSIHDGKDFQHLPHRLNVIIEAPKEEVTRIIKKHEQLTALCDHKWITILLMDDEGKISDRYLHSGHWESLISKEKEENIQQIDVYATHY